MGRRVGEVYTAKDFWQFAYDHAKMVPTVMGIITVVGFMSWKAYGEERLQAEIEKKIAPIRKDVKENSEKLESVDFATKQILLIMQKTTDKKIIEEVKQETEQFRPSK